MRDAVKPRLVFAWGNPSRGDDALGPLLVERLEAWLLGAGLADQVECLTDFQLQPEHALDLVGRAAVLLVDASVEAPAPFAVSAVVARRDESFSTHAMSPAALLQVFAETGQGAPPPCEVLAIRAQAMELGEGLSPAAAQRLEAALAWVREWAVRPTR